MAYHGDQTSDASAQNSPNASNWADNNVWADDENSNSDHAQAGSGAPQPEETLSDLPAMRRQHVTAGYREGLSITKAKVIQSGFDAGIPIGVEIGMRVGKIRGTLEGFLACKSVNVHAGMRELVAKYAAAAREELTLGRLLEDFDREQQQQQEQQQQRRVEHKDPNYYQQAVTAAHFKVPDSIQDKLSRWEGVAFGVTQARTQMLAEHREIHDHDWRELVLSVKHGAPRPVLAEQQGLDQNIKDGDTDGGAAGNVAPLTTSPTAPAAAPAAASLTGGGQKDVYLESFNGRRSTFW